jgi:hypothetical protein
LLSFPMLKIDVEARVTIYHPGFLSSIPDLI